MFLKGDRTVKKSMANFISKWSTWKYGWIIDVTLLLVELIGCCLLALMLAANWQCKDKIYIRHLKMTNRIERLQIFISSQWCRCSLCEKRCPSRCTPSNRFGDQNPAYSSIPDTAALAGSLSLNHPSPDPNRQRSDAVDGCRHHWVLVFCKPQPWNSLHFKLSSKHP